MNKFKILVGCLLLFSLCSCSENEAPVYSRDGDGLYFVSDMDTDAPLGQSVKSYSFTDIRNGGKSVDTTQLLVRVSGDMEDYDRSFDVQVVDDTITTADASMYNILECIVPAGSIYGAVNIEVIKSDVMDNERFFLELALVQTEDFPNLDMAISSGFLEITSLESEPSNWENYLRFWFGSYSPKWLDFIKEYTQDPDLGYKYYENQQAIDDLVLWFDESGYSFYASYFSTINTEDGGNAGDPNLDIYAKKLKIVLQVYELENGEPFTHDDGTPVVMP